MAVLSKSAERYLGKRLPETQPEYNAFYATGETAVHRDEVTWTGQKPQEPQTTKKGGS